MKGDAPPNSPRAARPEPGDPPAEVRGVDPTVTDVPDPRSGSTSGAPAPNTSSAPTAKKKPVKIDPKVLERFLQRNANRPDGQ
jgi:hypothetical protein